MSRSLSEPMTLARQLVPSGSWQRMSVALSMTWWLVSISPSGEMTTPDPEACAFSSLPEPRLRMTVRT